ncbi:ribosome small subunit-dependent GTPase A [Magnetococcus marinus MC-1]|uniref:Small ribosomal subunit biogenesis GTPase RsgA n=1 Tax=Magnetococcus marinus (strain ATCC BAA-1437 / JCM 17883 / MC-1) TaxID=156889 RepID=A0LCF1_MAGMM|nr:ribosome small subunit-dependent GTPase A [Magnetococcus marinus]ABK45644.1 ribosome small subunit-dependent GTPase A [Magnetococcus marinus MC-1]
MPRRPSGIKKLSDQQKRRIEAIRERRMNRKQAKSAEHAAEFDAQGLGEPREGLVIAHYGLNVAVTSEGMAEHRCAVRETLPENPVCGDRVIWRPGLNEQGVIEDIMPRSNVLRRPGPYNRLQTLAANLDRLLVTTSAALFNPFLVDRYLVAASAANIEPVIIVNKMDLIRDEESLDDLAMLLAPYQEMEYEIVPVSATTGQGMGELDDILSFGLSAFVGQSGVGKSSLVAHWIDDLSLRIADVNAHTGKGRHTTTVAHLYPLKSGRGGIIDSPGVRAFGLHGVEPEEVIHHFRDLAPLAQQCHFNDCKHEQEPGCAVLEAIEHEIADAIRLESYHRILESILEEEG